ncbi:MAG: hypothetical protein KJP18_09420 [Gemmatimonadetes bacterium]|nr:hypothetical protein [Gemmatimonadota bacterium]NNK64887.1 hypothetical protein [Gemmatimonadota bacterium]
MSTKQAHHRFLRLGGEFAVIVVGVFLALAAESWWSEREERAYERDLRQDMLAEFEANLDILEADLAANDTSQARIAAFLDLGAEELQATPSEELTGTIGRWLDWAGFDPEMGSAQALVESGNIGAIDDRGLRLLLSRWAGLLEEKRRFNLQAVEFQMHRVGPMIARAVSDEVWTAAERREAQWLVRTFAVLQGSVIDNQRRLQAAAREILTYLRE